MRDCTMVGPVVAGCGERWAAEWLSVRVASLTYPNLTQLRFGDNRSLNNWLGCLWLELTAACWAE